MNVHKMFRRRLLNVLCTFNLPPVPRGKLVLFYLKCWFSPDNFKFIEILYQISKFGYGGNCSLYREIFSGWSSVEEKPDIFVIEGSFINTLLRNITLILLRIKLLQSLYSSGRYAVNGICLFQWKHKWLENAENLLTERGYMGALVG